MAGKKSFMCRRGFGRAMRTEKIDQLQQLIEQLILNNHLNIQAMEGAAPLLSKDWLQIWLQSLFWS